MGHLKKLSIKVQVTLWDIFFLCSSPHSDSPIPTCSDRHGYKATLPHVVVPEVGCASLQTRLCAHSAILGRSRYCAAAGGLAQDPPLLLLTLL